MIPIIAIDGPSGSGKGTVSRLLAQEFGWHFLDSGSLYRVLAMAVLKYNIDVEDRAVLVALVHDLDIKFVSNAEDEPIIYLDGENVSAAIRTEECGKMASFIAPIPEVRKALFVRQRAFLQLPGLVADGRDMGTVVFPEAKVKIFLTASHEERARRRYLQLQAKGISVSLRDVLQELVERDARDQKRQVAPLKPAADARLVDTTNVSIKEVVKQVKDYVEEVYGTVV
ncbi:MAG: (d)CMP kinase [Gammaproteobacteria bacterium]|nr:(d)CMP kinase [Gammaproteobacteria bacterium]